MHCRPAYHGDPIRLFVRYQRRCGLRIFAGGRKRRPMVIFFWWSDRLRILIHHCQRFDHRALDSGIRGLRNRVQPCRTTRQYRSRLNKLLGGCGWTLGRLERKGGMAREDRAYETQGQQQPLHYENRPTVSLRDSTKLHLCLAMLRVHAMS